MAMGFVAILSRLAMLLVVTFWTAATFIRGLLHSVFTGSRRLVPPDPEAEEAAETPANCSH